MTLNDLLIEAAGRMSEDARAALDVHGYEWWTDASGWSVAGKHMTYDVITTSNQHVLSAPVEETRNYLMRWHPLVAITTARLLSRIASEGFTDDDFEEDDFLDAALQLARYYLGRSEGAQVALVRTPDVTRAIGALRSIKDDRATPMHIAADIDQVLVELLGADDEWTTP